MRMEAFVIAGLFITMLVMYAYLFVQDTDFGWGDAAHGTPNVAATPTVTDQRQSSLETKAREGRLQPF